MQFPGLQEDQVSLSEKKDKAGCGIHLVRCKHTAIFCHRMLGFLAGTTCISLKIGICRTRETTVEQQREEVTSRRLHSLKNKTALPDVLPDVLPERLGSEQ